MIYITGDTHSIYDIGKLDTPEFAEIEKNLTKNDYLIICGDFGFTWSNSKKEKEYLKYLSSKNYTILWIDGNHENFYLLYSKPVRKHLEIKMRRIVKDIYHIPRGEILELEGKTFLFFGGADSWDKVFRTEYITWWKEELPTVKELNYALKNLEKYNYTVDYVVTHCAPSSVLKLINKSYKKDPATEILEQIHQKIKFKRWYFGHYHEDRDVGKKFTLLYNEIRLVPTQNDTE